LQQTLSKGTALVLSALLIEGRRNLYFYESSAISPKRLALLDSFNMFVFCSRRYIETLCVSVCVRARVCKSFVAYVICTVCLSIDAYCEGRSVLSSPLNLVSTQMFYLVRFDDVACSNRSLCWCFFRCVRV